MQRFQQFQRFAQGFQMRLRLLMKAVACAPAADDKTAATHPAQRAHRNRTSPMQPGACLPVSQTSTRTAPRSIRYFTCGRMVASSGVAA